MNTKKQGNGLIVVLIIVTTLAIGVYSVSDLINGELRLNKKASVFHDAKQVAESLIQSAMADLKYRFDNSPSFPVDALSPSKNPLYITDEFVSRHNTSVPESYLVLDDTSAYTSSDLFNTRSTEIIGGQVPGAEAKYINPKEAGYEKDELAYMTVLQRRVELLSKATVDRPGIGVSTAYARQFLEVRDVPLFSYAIYYNLPMEIAPGKPMDIHGNVHVNGDAWIQSSKGLNFHSRVTIAGDLKHGRHPDSGKDKKEGAVNFLGISDDLVNMQQDGKWVDSLIADFREKSEQLWGSNLQTEVHGVVDRKIPGMNEYIEDTNGSTTAKESFNSAYPIIQPALNENQLSVPGSSYDPDLLEAEEQRLEAEKQKFAYKAGLTIKVAPDGSLTYTRYDKNADDSLNYDSSGNPVSLEVTPKATDIVEYKPFERTNGVITSGLYDKRQDQGINIIELDIGKLKESIHENEVDDWNGDPPWDATDPYKGWWNGVVYVEFPQQNNTSTREDGVNPANQGWGLKLINGKTIPNPTVKQEIDIYGTTVATNQMMYVQGHYNADGYMSTGSPTEPDNSETFASTDQEAPAALIADAITFLSEGWNDSNSDSDSLDTRIAQPTEVSAAILTGLVPSGETGSNSYSGGVENFPRFLEKWKDVDFMVRGSIVALFESEVATEPWGKSDVYSAPNRKWGFNQKFAEGYLPPGTPYIRSYRGRDFQLLSENEYAEHVERIKDYFQ